MHIDYYMWTSEHAPRADTLAPTGVRFHVLITIIMEFLRGTNT